MKKECLFCKIISGQAPAEFVYENEDIVVFKDIYPKAPVHLLIVPKKHIRSINELTETDKEVVSEMILTARDMAKKTLIYNSGYKLVFNVEKGGGQEVFHLHLHLIGGWK